MEEIRPKVSDIWKSPSGAIFEVLIKGDGELYFATPNHVEVGEVIFHAVSNVFSSRHPWTRLHPPVIDRDKLEGKIRKIFLDHALDDKDESISKIVDLVANQKEV